MYIPLLVNSGKNVTTSDAPLSKNARKKLNKLGVEPFILKTNNIVVGDSVVRKMARLYPLRKLSTNIKCIFSVYNVNCTSSRTGFYINHP